MTIARQLIGVVVEGSGLWASKLRKELDSISLKKFPGVVRKVHRYGSDQAVWEYIFLKDWQAKRFAKDANPKIAWYLTDYNIQFKGRVVYIHFRKQDVSPLTQ